MNETGSRTFRPVWSLAFIAAIIHTAGFILFMTLISPLWIELDDYLGMMIGMKARWVLIILLLTACVLLFIILGYARAAAKGIDTGRAFRYSAVLSFIIFNVLVFSLATSMAKYSIPSIIPFTRMSLAFTALGLLFLVLMAIFQRAAARSAGGSEPSLRVSMRYGKAYIMAFTAVFACLSAWSAFTDMNKWPPPERAVPAEKWKAAWISVPDASLLQKAAPSLFRHRENTWICFRKDFVLENSPRRMPARIGADSKYWLWINGKLAVFEGGLKRGPNPYDTYYDSVNIAPFLKKGRNTIAVLLWHFGKDGFGHKDSGMAGLIFECSAPGISITSDETWKAVVHPSYFSTGAPHPNFRLQESNIGFDARKDMPGWTAPGYDDSMWANAAIIARPPDAPFNYLIARPIPLWKTGELRSYPGVKVSARSGVKTIECALPYNAQVTPYLKVKGPAGRKIDMRTDNYFGGAAYNVRAEYITRDGIHEYESLGWMNGHKVLYTIPEGVETLELKYRETGYDTSFAGDFRCEDSFLNSLWKKSARTLYVGMRDYLMDCPDRERAQWWCETCMLMAFYSLDARSRMLLKKEIDEITGWRKRDGALYAPVPSGNWYIELPIQMAAVVGQYGLWTYYMYTGDIDTVRRAYPHAKKYLSMWEDRDDGLVVPREGQWNQADWGTNIDLFLFSNEWYYTGLLGMKNLAKELGHADDAEQFDKRIRAFREGFNKKLFTKDGFRTPGYTGQTDDRSNSMAVVTGLASKDTYDAVKNVLVKNRFSSPYMEKYVAEALIQMGYTDEALSRLKDRFRDMVKSPLTTLWEGWEVGSVDYGGGTINHPWAGTGLIILSQFIGGISPVKPGFSEFEIKPREGSLTSIDEKVRTRFGDIELAIRKSPRVYRLTASVPGGTRAHVYLHKRDARHRNANKISVNDAPLGKNRMEDAPGDYYRVIVPAGRYRFTVEY